MLIDYYWLYVCNTPFPLYRWLSLTFGRQRSYHTITGRLQISTRAPRQAFWVASLLAGSTSSRPFFCFLCNLRSLHDAQGTDARPCEVSHRYVKSPHQPLRFDVEEGATLNYYNRPKSGPTTSPEGVNDKGGMVYSIKYYLRIIPSYLRTLLRTYVVSKVIHYSAYSRIYTAEYIWYDDILLIIYKILLYLIIWYLRKLIIDTI